jgi:tetratricopeptide (TPR) repeat protein
MRHHLRKGGSAPGRVILALGALSWAAEPARADDAAASAQVLFDQATALKNEERWAEACPKFDASYKLDPALGTLLNLANCYEKLGLVASAWATWDEAFQWATKNNDDRADYAKTQRDGLAPRLPKLTIRVENPVPALTIERDRTKVSSAMYNSALPVDPGEHKVFVKRGDEVLRTEKVTAVEAQSVEVKLDLAAIEKAAPPPPKPKTKEVVVVGVSPALRTAGWIVGGVGLGGVAIGGLVELVALSKKAQADDPNNCLNKVCTPMGYNLANEARGNAEAGQWVTIGGLVVTAVGVTLLMVAPRQIGIQQAPGGKDKKDASGRRDVWAAPWMAMDPAAPRGSPQVGGGIVIGGNL